MSSRYRTIFLDVDGVLADIMPHWLEVYNLDFNDDLRPEDITHWGIDRYIKCDMDRMMSYLKNPLFYDEVKPVAGALEGFELLKLTGHRIVLATSGAFVGKIEWLKRYGMYNSKDVIITDDKSILEGDILIDDRLKNVVDFRGKGILFSQPWNTRYAYPVRAFDWVEVPHLVSELLKEE